MLTRHFTSFANSFSQHPTNCLITFSPTFNENTASSRGLNFALGGNIYVGGREAGYGLSVMNISCANPATINSQFAMSVGTASAVMGASVCADSSGNMYMQGDASLSAAPNNIASLVKINSSKVIQWQKHVYESGYVAWGTAVKIDPSGNVYHCWGSASGKNFVTKYNYTGTAQWTVYYCGASGRCDIAVDSAGNVYYFDAGQYPVVAKWNTSGTLQWGHQYTIDAKNNFSDRASIVVAPGGAEVAVLSQVIAGNGYAANMLRVNSSGVNSSITRLTGGSSDQLLARSITVDSSGNYYALSSAGSGSTSALFKTNSSGAIQWQRSINKAASSISWDSSTGHLFVTCDDGSLLKLKDDGSGIGTYGAVNYAQSSYTESHPSTVTGSTPAANSIGSPTAFSLTFVSNTISNVPTKTIQTA